MNGEIYIALCDDDKYTHEITEQLIKEYSRIRNIRFILINFFSAKELLMCKKDFKILFLDIDMPGMDGIEAANCLMDNGKDYKIIMLTGISERFKEAFKIGAYRFVTKPIDIEEFYEALDSVIKSLCGYQKIKIKFQNIYFEILQCDIHYIKACGDYVKIYTQDKIYESNTALKKWLAELDEHLFVKCHKSYIVNLGKVKYVGKNIVYLKNGKEIPVSRRCSICVKQKFLEYDIMKF